LAQFPVRQIVNRRKAVEQGLVLRHDPDIDHHGIQDDGDVPVEAEVKAPLQDHEEHREANAGDGTGKFLLLVQDDPQGRFEKHDWPSGSE
jgi:hypothetical protein